MTLIVERVNVDDMYHDGASTRATQCTVAIINLRQELVFSAIKSNLQRNKAHVFSRALIITTWEKTILARI